MSEVGEEEEKFVCPRCGNENWGTVWTPEGELPKGILQRECKGEFSPPNDYLGCRYKFRWTSDHDFLYRQVWVRVR